MKKILILWLLLNFTLPVNSYAANFSQIFSGYADNVPIKLKLTNVDNQLRGTYAYKNGFETSYIPDKNFIFGQEKNNQITLNTDKGSIDNVNFQGTLVPEKQYGQTVYVLKGQWQDKIHLINKKVELHQLVIGADTKNPIINKFEAHKDTKNFYTTEISYPFFSGNNLTPNEISINQKIKKFVDDQVSGFTQTIQKINAEESFQNLNTNSYQFFIDNSVTNSRGILSIRFMLFQSMYHAAHPNTTYTSLNFDMQSDKLITLSGLFKPNSNYLEVLAKIIRPELIKKLYPNLKGNDLKNFDVEWINEGTKPIAKNYQVWNIYKDNLMITFPAYQVAAYVYGEQTIIIPFAKLRAIIKPNSLLAQNESSFY